MSDTVIRVENLSKKYVIGHQKQERYTALRDVIADKVRGIRNIFNRHAQEQDEAFEEFWALKDVSFEIKQGDRVGIIGRNGAGKSTLLKVLSRITEPTSGKISIKGRVASLLEVGTGFHPELTGRENIFLNGAILGMDRFEIRKKFDEIVAFAEVEKFLDTPVKRYSSGMYVRLAFAVAAHLEPEILIVDEVLAVGDAQFQKKCIGKMEDVGKEGRSIIFVSHNIPVIRQLCKYGILLKSGSVIVQGNMDECIAAYLPKAEQNNCITFESNIFADNPHFKSIKITNPSIQYGSSLFIEISVISKLSIDVAIEIEIHDLQGIPIFYGSTSPMDNKLIFLNPDESVTLKINTAPLYLAMGKYKAHFWLIKPWQKNYHIVDEGLIFEVETSDPLNTGFSFRQSYQRGCIALPINILLDSD